MDQEHTLSKVQPERRSYLYWLFSDSWVMTKRSITHIIRSLDQVLSLILFPVMFMLLNRYVLGGAIDTGNVSYANYLFAGIFVQTLACFCAVFCFITRVIIANKTSVGKHPAKTYNTL